MIPSDFIPELCCSPRQSQRGHKLGSHTLLIVLPLLQSGVVADTDGQEERASDGIRRAWEWMHLMERDREEVSRHGSWGRGICSNTVRQRGRQNQTVRKTKTERLDEQTHFFLIFHLQLSGSHFAHFWPKDLHLVVEVLKYNHGSLYISETHKVALIL